MSKWGILEALAHVHEWRPYATPYGFYFQGASFAVCTGCGAAWPPPNPDPKSEPMVTVLEAVRRYMNVPGPSCWEGA